MITWFMFDSHRQGGCNRGGIQASSVGVPISVLLRPDGYQVEGAMVFLVIEVSSSLHPDIEP